MRLTVLATVIAPILLLESATAQAAWTRQYPSQSPPARIYSAMAGDEVNGVVVLLFGQSNGNGPINDSWLWDGSNWQASAAALPPVRVGHSMVWDGARQRVVMFGGQVFLWNNLFQDLWEWDGSQWLSRTPAASPPARAWHSMAFDQSRGVIVLFGGGDGVGLLNDTWEWNGTHWSQSNPVMRPSVRAGAGMAFDPVNASVLLYGGGDVNGVPLVDTWSWNGTNWQLRTPATPPTQRGNPAMVTDTCRQRVVLYGGNNYDMFPWEWDGAQWHQLYTPTGGPRLGSGSAYDATHRAVVYFGGNDPSFVNWMSDTWVYSTPWPATNTSYGGGCAGSEGIPVLASAPYSLPWIGDTLHMRVSPLALTTTTVLFGTGLDPTTPVDLSQYGMPSCNGLVSVLIVDFVAASSGSAEWSIAVPNTAALAGAHVFQQAFALEAGANAAGVVASNGADMMIGIR